MPGRFGVLLIVYWYMAGFALFLTLLFSGLEVTEIREVIQCSGIVV